MYVSSSGATSMRSTRSRDSTGGRSGRTSRTARTEARLASTSPGTRLRVSFAEARLGRGTASLAKARAGRLRRGDGRVDDELVQAGMRGIRSQQVEVGEGAPCDASPCRLQ